MHIQADAVVIGAGVVGASIALELQRAGTDVVVVDKAGGIGHGSTSASSGVVRFHYSSHAGVATSWEAVHGWTDWAGHLGYADPAGLARFQRTGMLVLEVRPGSSKATTDLFDEVGVPWEVWDAATIVDRLPEVDPGAFGPPARPGTEEFFRDAHGTLGGTFTPDAGFVSDPQLAAQNLGVAARHHGARFLLRAAVERIEMAGPRRWRLTTSDGRSVDADVVVNAGGPWSSRLNALAGVGGDFAVVSRPLRQEVHHVPVPRGLRGRGEVPGVAIADPDLGIYLRSAGAEGLLVGGMEPECDPLEWVDDPDQVDLRVTGAGFEAQVMRAARRLPDLTVPNRPSGLAGVYDATTDWTPIYDKTDAPGFYVAMGTSGNQFKNAPVVGHLMAELIRAVEGGAAHDELSVRVRMPRTGSVVDLAAYSRLRQVDPGAPASVMG